MIAAVDIVGLCIRGCVVRLRVRVESFMPGLGQGLPGTVLSWVMREGCKRLSRCLTPYSETTIRPTISKVRRAMSICLALRVLVSSQISAGVTLGWALTHIKARRSLGV